MSDSLLIPILVNHNAGTPPIGKMTSKAGKLELEFLPGHELTEAQFLEAFGNIGYQLGRTIHRDDGTTVIQSATIFEFSVPSTSP